MVYEILLVNYYFHNSNLKVIKNLTRYEFLTIIIKNLQTDYKRVSLSVGINKIFLLKVVIKKSGG